MIIYAAQGRGDTGRLAKVYYLLDCAPRCFGLSLDMHEWRNARGAARIIHKHEGKPENPNSQMIFTVSGCAPSRERGRERSPGLARSAGERYRRERRRFPAKTCPHNVSLVRGSWTAYVLTRRTSGLRWEIEKIA